ncbi:hypothetical protein ASD38_08985 [Caulobacter sp. Root487D2Y]|uniref:DUF454 family protein n=1 Tax=Caulobacter sp. Root487D2Y TaxID=1736547 RepID=UPI0006F95F4C|nr:DUF454 family protein [Caulobacter sp. Root487D2Y]KQY29472.1 hypothetical protein ASD38_08985 [Caulobacter sp. Root487D2Y]
MTDAPRSPRKRLSRPIHWVLDGLGVALLATGAVGAVVPGMPTTVFWIGAVMCFLKTRPHAVRPLLRTPIIGPAIRWYLRWRPFGGARRRGNTSPKA